MVPAALDQLEETEEMFWDLLLVGKEMIEGLMHINTAQRLVFS